MATAADILKKASKDFGNHIARVGGEHFIDTPRLPTGIFPLDLASGGGFPMGRVSVVYGPESSNKTNVVLKAIGLGQKLFPGKKAVFVDAEGGYDPIWAAILGVNTDELIVVHPEYAEQAVDIIEAFLYAEDVFVVALDSVAALSTQNEIESSAEKASVGGASLVIGKLFKKATVSFNRMRNQGFMPPAFIGINQIRHKIGVMYGDPETMPGGNALKFASSFTVRLYGKNVFDKKLSDTMPAFKETNVVIKKWKMPILSQSAVFNMQMLNIGDVPAGTVADWNTVSSYLKQLEYLSKNGTKGWIMFGDEFPTLDACKEHLYGSVELLNEAKSQIIQELMLAGGSGPSADEPNEDEASL